MSFTQLLATRGHRKNLPAELPQPDVPRLIAATDGFTGADLKRLVEDGKAIYVYDKPRGAELKPTTDYFMGAVEVVLSKSSPES
jgi:SpoVK/Ycf46/Vps4 family AAA+-type ATPase